MHRPSSLRETPRLAASPPGLCSRVGWSAAPPQQPRATPPPGHIAKFAVHESAGPHCRPETTAAQRAFEKHPLWPHRQRANSIPSTACHPTRRGPGLLVPSTACHPTRRGPGLLLVPLKAQHGGVQGEARDGHVAPSDTATWVWARASVDFVSSRDLCLALMHCNRDASALRCSPACFEIHNIAGARAPGMMIAHAVQVLPRRRLRFGGAKPT